MNVEFSLCPNGDLLIHDGSSVRTYCEEDSKITDELYAVIERDYPEAFSALQSLYKRSIANLTYFKYRVVHRFVRCNFGRFDDVSDVDANGNLNFDFVDCPIRCECPYHRVICGPKFNTKLSIREIEIMRHLCDGKSPAETADILCLSESTVATHRRNAYRRAGVNSLAEFTRYAEIHHLFKN